MPPTDKLTRRQALASAVHLTVLSGAALVASACDRGQLHCGDGGAADNLSEADRAQRKSSGYIDRTLDPKRRCDNCAYWHARVSDWTCGACAVVKGPIHPDAFCTLWAAPRG